MRRSVLSLCLALAPCFSLLACERPGPCFGLGLGERYQVQLLERYDEQSSYDFELGGPAPRSCGADFDLKPTDGVTVRVVEQQQGDPCDVNRVEIESSVGQELGPPAPREFALLQGTSSVFQAYRSATIAGCAGVWGLVVKSQVEPEGEDGNPFLEATPGEVPPIVLVRGFSVDEMTPECRALLGEGTVTCMDQFVAEVTRL